MNKDDIINRLNELSSSFAFGRVLSYTAFQENIGLHNSAERSSMDNKNRLMGTELGFLMGLWACNYNPCVKGWNIDKDDQIIDEVLNLMDKLHSYYLPNEEMNIYQQIPEIAFYEGDEGYDWQFIQFAESKYNDADIQKHLLDEFEFNTKFIRSLYVKCKNNIEVQMKERINCKKKSHSYISPINLFTLKPNKLEKILCKEEWQILMRLSQPLGNKEFAPMKSITDENPFSYFPVIKLPNDRGFFFGSFIHFAVALNENPYYWLFKDSNINRDYLAKTRGMIAEKIVSDILKKRFPNENIYIAQPIQKTKHRCNDTDIDVMLIHFESVIVFQVKSKRLSLLSKRGNEASIEDDFKKAIGNAYNQGVKCIDALKSYSQYCSLKSITQLESVRKYYNFCITLDQYPTLSTISLYKSYDVEKCDIPLMALSIYDLDAIVSLLPLEYFNDFMIYREEAAMNKIYGINEMYYLGAYMCNIIYDLDIHLEYNSIPREYAIFVDEIFNNVHIENRKIRSVNDIRKLIERKNIQVPFLLQS